MDPFRREIHISIGCALQNLLLEARAQGQYPQLAIAPGTLEEPSGQPQPKTVAVVELSAAPAFVSPLRAAIPRRHTNRGTSEPDRPIGGEVLAELTGLVEQDAVVRLWLVTDAAAPADFAAATAEATHASIDDAIMIGDSDAWSGHQSRDCDPPRRPDDRRSRALTTHHPARRNPPRAIGRARPQDLVRAHPRRSTGERSVLEQTIQAGRLWQRLHLEAALLGLGAQPLNRLPERVDRDRELGEPGRTAKLLAGLIPDPIWLVTFAFRIGWPTRAAALSPRRDLEAVMRPTSG
jgi:hypothetical protein